MKFLTISFVFASFFCYLNARSINGCPSNGKIGPDGKCYVVYTGSLIGNGTWVAAKDYCHQQGGVLASIHNAIMNQWLFKWGGNTWFGLYCLPSTNYKFVYVDGTKIDYQNYDSGMPTDCQDVPEDEGDCVLIQYDSTWTTDSCTRGGGWSVACSF